MIFLSPEDQWKHWLYAVILTFSVQDLRFQGLFSWKVENLNLSRRFERIKGYAGLAAEKLRGCSEHLLNRSRRWNSILRSHIWFSKSDAMMSDRSSTHKCHFIDAIIGLVPSHSCSWIFPDSMCTYPAELKQQRTLQDSSRDPAKQKPRVKPDKIWPTICSTTLMPKSDLHLWDGCFKFRNGLACISPKRTRVHGPWPWRKRMLCT